MTDHFAIALVSSAAISAFLAVLFNELRILHQDKEGLNYKPYYDYAYIYGWVVTSTIVAVAISLAMGRP